MSETFINTFCKMVQISSESGNEKDFIDYLKDLFTKEIGANCALDNYGNLIAKISAKNSSSVEPIFFGVHADTVKPGENIEPVIENQIIYSKGETILGADDKAGIAELFEAIRTADCYPPIEIVVSREEEVGFKGARNIDTSLLRSKMGFVVDTDNLTDIIVGGPSYMSIKVDITGKAAHAGMEPEKGISSIKAASYAISTLKEGWIDDETTVNVGVIRGGEVLNAVPEKTEVKVECRSQIHEKCLRRSALIKQIFLNAAESIGARADVTMELLVQCYRISEDTESVSIAKKAVSTAGLHPKVKVICGGTEAAIYNEKGIETAVIGIGVQSEHTKDEKIAVADMIKAVEIIQQIFKNFCENG
jgi:tripeptide aminopeptidase